MADVATGCAARSLPGRGVVIDEIFRRRLGVKRADDKRVRSSRSEVNVFKKRPTIGPRAVFSRILRDSYDFLSMARNQMFSHWSRTIRRTTATNWSFTPKNPCRCSVHRYHVHLFSRFRKNSGNSWSSKVSDNFLFVCLIVCLFVRLFINILHGHYSCRCWNIIINGL